MWIRWQLFISLIMYCMLMDKSGEYVNLIRKKQNREFVTEQSIHFGGLMIDDEVHLIHGKIQ
ncbi:unnamed protein product [Paramecium sonneborni]|uniref:Uncharacterized protein n=1 Tax=Paramecium sonneborni TaxID=65129 RepID=A0A8S1RUE5_9CILI|nr:unnamed protein product [Paramecium sonneborni]